MNKDNICPLCKSTNTILYAKSNYDINNITEYSFASRKNPEYMHYTLMKCKDCDLLYSVDIVDREKFHDMYTEASFDSKNEANFASKTYIKYFDKVYKKHIRGGVSINFAMDIGTGEGSFLKELLNYGVKNVIGVEPSNEAINQADESIKKYIINGFFNADNFDDKKFDLITCFQAIEHIENPLNLFNDIYKLLNENGALFIVCHSYNYFVNRIIGMKSPIYDIEHLQIFSKKSVKRIFELSGLKNIEVFSICNNYPLSYWVKLFPFPNKIKKILLKFLNITLIGNIKIPINVGNIGCIGYKI